MANIERMKQLHKFISELPHGKFQWSSCTMPASSLAVSECGTPACVAGWAGYLWPPEKVDLRWDLGKYLKTVLDITTEEANFVCYGEEWSSFPSMRNLDFPEQRQEALTRLEALIHHYENNIS
jgi:hypothetical protein